MHSSHLTTAHVRWHRACRPCRRCLLLDEPPPARRAAYSTQQTLERCSHVTAQPGFEPQVRCATPLASERGGSTTLRSSSGSTIAEQHDRRAARSSSSTIAEQHDRRAARPWVRGLYWGFEEALGRPRTGPLASLSNNLALNQRTLIAASTHGRRCVWWGKEAREGAPA